MVKVLAEVTGSISFSQRGEKGQKGALMREHDGFESGSYKYLSGAGEEAYIDVVCVKREWYQCTKTYDNETSSPSLTDGHWTKMSQYKSIATHLLLAENATINMLGTNQINLFNPTTDGKMFGSFRVVSDDNDYALWLGAPNGADAPFSVKRSGFTKMTEADVTGKINATSGTFNNVSINSGTIGGFTISGNGLTNEKNFGDDAYIILRNDNAGAFAGIGGNLLPASSGLRAVARFQNENKSKWFKYDNMGQNYAMILSAKNADRNIALSIFGGYIEGFALKTTITTSENYSVNRTEHVVSFISDKSSTDWVTFRLPDMQWYDEGHFVMLSRESIGNYQFRVKPGYSYDKDGKRHETYIFWHGQKYTISNFDTDYFTAYGSVIMVYNPRWKLVSGNAVMSEGIWLAYGVS